MVESMAGGARGQTWRLSISQGDVAEVYGTGFPSTRSTEGERDREGREQRPAAVAASSGGERLGRQVDNMVAFKSNSTCRNHWPCHMEVMQLHRMTTFRFQHAHIT